MITNPKDKKDTLGMNFVEGIGGMNNSFEEEENKRNKMKKSLSEI